MAFNIKIKRTYMVWGILIVAVIVLGIWFFIAARKNPGELVRSDIRVGNTQFNVEIADTIAAREQGLSGRDELRAHEGMLFNFQIPGIYPFWMKDMKFPIDIVWIRNNRVIGAEENIDPQIGVSVWKLKLYSPPGIVDTVLEISAGGVKAYGIEVGDLVN